MNPETIPISAQDDASMRAIISEQGEAWNRADAQAFAARYREDGSFTNIAGVRIYGKAGFIDMHKQIFLSIFEGSHIALVIDRIHLLRPDVAVVEVDAILTQIRQPPSGVTLASDGVLHSRLQEVMTRDHDGWQVAAFHNVAVSVN